MTCLDQSGVILMIDALGNEAAELTDWTFQLLDVQNVPEAITTPKD